MDTILEQLLSQYTVKDKDNPLEQEITQCHQTLIQHLSKADRRVVLRIMDCYGHLECQCTLKAFQTGFYLAWKLSQELHAFEGTCNQ
ncbi:hypothetical protein RFF05_04375 [Bengtsoniella intestinalis]|uniref:hypothetical protein n=1 Tax=Bengtsoniella intestinalis TaxID=3073143 RepID=UPI00391F02A6